MLVDLCSNKLDFVALTVSLSSDLHNVCIFFLLSLSFPYQIFNGFASTNIFLMDQRAVSHSEMTIAINNHFQLVPSKNQYPLPCYRRFRCLLSWIRIGGYNGKLQTYIIWRIPAILTFDPHTWWLKCMNSSHLMCVWGLRLSTHFSLQVKFMNFCL